MRGATRHDRHVRYVPWVGAVLDGLLAVLAPAVAVLDVALGSVRHTVNNHYNGITEKRRVEKNRYMGRAGEFYYFIVQVLLNSSPSHNTSHICLTTPRQLAHTQSNPRQQVTSTRAHTHGDSCDEYGARVLQLQCLPVACPALWHP
jgi:hypothetical protein